jgi:hypothetical protein
MLTFLLESKPNNLFICAAKSSIFVNNKFEPKKVSRKARQERKEKQTIISIWTLPCQVGSHSL